jgi:hypothetical protein
VQAQQQNSAVNHNERKTIAPAFRIVLDGGATDALIDPDDRPELSSLGQQRTNFATE